MLLCLGTHARDRDRVPPSPPPLTPPPSPPHLTHPTHPDVTPLVLLLELVLPNQVSGAAPHPITATHPSVAGVQPPRTPTRRPSPSCSPTVVLPGSQSSVVGYLRLVLPIQ
jgi:hypothetical protein